MMEKRCRGFNYRRKVGLLLTGGNKPRALSSKKLSSRSGVYPYSTLFPDKKLKKPKGLETVRRRKNYLSRTLSNDILIRVGLEPRKLLSIAA